jgi:hypothetical protein
LFCTPLAYFPREIFDEIIIFEQGVKPFKTSLKKECSVQQRETGGKSCADVGEGWVGG